MGWSSVASIRSISKCLSAGSCSRLSTSISAGAKPRSVCSVRCTCPDIVATMTLHADKQARAWCGQRTMIDEEKRAVELALCRITRRGLIKVGAGTAGLAVVGSRLNQSSAQESYKITLIQGVAGDEFYVSMGCGAQQAATETGSQVTIQGTEKWDATLQIPLLNSVVQSKPDAILIAPNDRTALIQPIQDALTAGTAVFKADIAIANIASDNVLGGKMAAQELAKLINETGSVYLQNTVPGASTTDQRQ